MSADTSNSSGSALSATAPPATSAGARLTGRVSPQHSSVTKLYSTKKKKTAELSEDLTRSGAAAPKLRLRVEWLHKLRKIEPILLFMAA